MSDLVLYIAFGLLICIWVSRETGWPKNLLEWLAFAAFMFAWPIALLMVISDHLPGSRNDV